MTIDEMKSSRHSDILGALTPTTQDWLLRKGRGQLSLSEVVGTALSVLESVDERFGRPWIV